MMQSSDPFSLVYRALWSMLESHTGFTGLVRTGNRIKFSGAGRDPMKSEILSADLPEVRIVPAGGPPMLMRTSSSGSVVKRFQIQIATGEQRTDQTESLFAVEWEIIKAMHGWEAVLGALEITIGEGESAVDVAFVKRCTAGEISEGVTDTDLNRGIRGWSAVWSCEVEMWFPTVALQPSAL